MYDQKRVCKKSFNKYKYFIKLAIISNLHNITVFFLIENHIILKINAPDMLALDIY